MFFRILASQLWEQVNMDFPAVLSEQLLTDIEHPVECIQSSAAKALGALLENDRNQIEHLLKLLMQLYKDRLKVILYPGLLFIIFLCTHFR